MEQKEYLKTALQEFHITLQDKQLDQLLTFYDLLVEKNKVMNLTAITEFEEVVFKHFLDSLAICKVSFDGKTSMFQANKAEMTDADSTDQVNRANQNKRKASLIDVGCGAGFPGMVIAIAYPEVQVTLLDSLQKRVGFLGEVIEKLAIANCSAVHFRAEEAARMKEYRDRYDFAVSRAVANLSTLSEYCLPYVKPGGYFIAYKSEKIREEAPAAQKAIKLLGGKFASETEFYLPDSIQTGLDIQSSKGNMDDGGREKISETGKKSEQKISSQGDRADRTDSRGAGYRNLYVIKKTGPTPAKYPRKAPLPAKKPL